MKLFRKPAPTALLLLALACGCIMPSSAAEAEKGIVDPKKQSAQLVQEGLNYLILEQNKKAEELFIKAKSLDPYSEQSYNFLGLLYLQEGLNDKAEDMLKQAISIEPMYPEALRNLGKLCLKEDRFKEASAYLKKTLSIDEKQPYTWYLLGMAQYFSGHNTEAIEAYETAFAMEPNLPTEARYNLGVAYHESSRYLDAVRCNYR